MDPLSNTQKTPISLLQELCARHSLTPDYKVLSVEGAVHAPTFTFRVEVGETVATAVGQSKKKAKHSAAKAVLEKLLGPDGKFSNMKFSDGSTFDSESLTTAIASSEPETESDIPDDGVPGNPVGGLQELCMKRRWRPPYYQTVIEKGLPHERTFVIACRVGRADTIGTGKSKRLAKRQAAHQMMKQLEEQLEKGLDLNGEEITQSHSTSILKDGVEGVTDEQTSLGIPNHSGLVQKFIEKIKETPDPRLLTDISNSVMESYVHTLVNISEDQCFDINFVPIKEASYSGKHYCLVQLGSIPLAVCFGNGLTQDKAKEDAAHNALLFLRVLTRGKTRS